MAKKSSSFRRDLRRNRRKLDEAGASFRFATEETVERDVGEFLRLHRMRLGELGGTSLPERGHRADAARGRRRPAVVRALPPALARAGRGDDRLPAAARGRSRGQRLEQRLRRGAPRHSPSMQCLVHALSRRLRAGRAHDEPRARGPGLQVPALQLGGLREVERDRSPRRLLPAGQAAARAPPGTPGAREQALSRRQTTLASPGRGCSWTTFARVRHHDDRRPRPHEEQLARPARRRLRPRAQLDDPAWAAHPEPGRGAGQALGRGAGGAPPGDVRPPRRAGRPPAALASSARLRHALGRPRQMGAVGGPPALSLAPRRGCRPAGRLSVVSGHPRRSQARPPRNSRTWSTPATPGSSPRRGRSRARSPSGARGAPSCRSGATRPGWS